MTREEWIKIYNAKDGTWDKDDLIDKAYEIMTSPNKTNYDRIKSMSVEEMAEFNVIHDAEYNMYLSLNGFLYGEKEVAIQKNIEWLLQEVSDE